mgnify:CR=1 FL=1
MEKKIKTKILVIVDMQQDFISGSLANPAAEKIVEPICNLIENEEYDKIILTRDTHDENYLNSPEGKKLPIEHCLEQTSGWCVDSRILKALRGKKYTYENKHNFGFTGWNMSYGSFNCENIEITICGTVTSICVVSNAIIMKAQFPNANIKVIGDLCADITPENHEAALAVMRACQIEVI